LETGVVRAQLLLEVDRIVATGATLVGGEYRSTGVAKWSPPAHPPAWTFLILLMLAVSALGKAGQKVVNRRIANPISDPGSILILWILEKRMFSARLAEPQWWSPHSYAYVPATRNE
jgi:hypothetical protein